MEHINTYSEFVNEAKKPKSWDTMFAMNAIKAYEDGEFDPKNKASLAKWEKDYNGGVTPKPGFETSDIISYAMEIGKKPDGSPIKESVNEGVLTIAGGVALGLVGAIALIKGAGAAAQFAGNVMTDLADKADAKRAAKEAAKRKAELESIVMPIVKKFEDDTNLQAMYDKLPDYTNSISKKGKASNNERSKGLREISKYIKSKLTPEEEKYFSNVSKYLRTGVIESENLTERNAFLGARAKAIEEDADEFEFNGKVYPILKRPARVNEELDHSEVLQILDAAAMFADDAHVAADQMWRDKNDLIDYLLSDHIPKKYHKQFLKYVK